jgi:hypothetical protein
MLGGVALELEIAIRQYNWARAGGKKFIDGQARVI